MANRRKPSNISVTRRTLIGVLASVTGIALAVRIGAVNNAAVHIPEKTYGKNEWLDMDDCYLGTDDYTCEGYRFMVTNVAIMTPGEYLRLYGSDGAAIESDDNARKCVATVSMRVGNDGTSERGISLFLYHLVPLAAPNTIYDFNTELFAHAYPELGGESGFRIASGAENEVHIPFCGYEYPRPFQPLGAFTRPEIDAGTFRLKMTDLPVRKTFVVESA